MFGFPLSGLVGFVLGIWVLNSCLIWGFVAGGLLSVLRGLDWMFWCLICFVVFWFEFVVGLVFGDLYTFDLIAWCLVDFGV